ncbi:hypothetical protein C6Y14_00450 [Streptomyces dioscori]|uniref:DUF4333 domain-containing protein n=1 Tax=Streptomyces dioscori TaxID=2109333 RepID=A0A2P8QEG3_9ACTN|nr:DUF4333 domain-containing protein [Streptomyces dioscori]PSM44655.1 hypothetical protein C6Y14_00450 [Streptomyces dioscori]
MQHTGRRKRIATAAALGALTMLLATGCSFSAGDAEKKDEATAGKSSPAVEEQPTAEEEPTAAGQPTAEGSSPTASEQPVGDDPSKPENTGVSEDGAVHKARVAQTISDKLTADTGKRPDRVTCPQHLPARVGATIHCDLTAGGSTFDVTVTAASVNGNQVYYNYKVDNTAK